MFLSHALSIALAAALVNASPVPKSPTPIARRDLPKPSTYPLGDACVHEWKYLNFDKDDETDRAHLEKLHGVICSGEMRAISSYGAGSADRNLAPYKRFMPPNDDDEDEPEEYQKQVSEVLRLISGTSSTDGAIGSIVESFIVDNEDFGTHYPGEDNCGMEGVQGYNLVDDNDDRDGLEKIHFCEIGFALGGAGDVDCGSLDPYPSEKMDSFSRLALHEMTHYSTVGPETLLDDQIGDFKHPDGAGAYGPVRAHALVDPDQGNDDDDDDDGELDYYNPHMAPRNADSYAWMALDAWISRHCAADPSGDNWASFFTEDPPAIDDENR